MIRKRLAIAWLLAICLGSPAGVAAASPEAAGLLERAQFWQGRKRDDLARDELAKLFRLEPGNAEGLVMLARIQLRANQQSEGSATLDRLRKSHPGHPGIAQLEAQVRILGPDKERLRLARQLGRAGRIDEAVKAYRAIFPAVFPDDEVALEYAQLVAASRGGRDTGRALLADLARRHPSDARFQVALASHMSTRKPVGADTLKALRELSADADGLVARQAREAWRRAVLAMDPVEENLAALRDYIAANPGETAVSERLEEVTRAIAQGRRARALPAARADPVPRAEAAAPKDPAEGAKRDGWAALEAGRTGEAEARLLEASRIRPDDAEAVGGLGVVRLRQERHGEAVELFERARRLEPASAAKWSGLADTARYWGLLRQAQRAREAGAFDVAEARVREARAIDASEPNAAAESARIAGARAGRLREQARELLAQGRRAEAIAALEQGAALAPLDPWVRHDLARLYAAHGDAQRGRQLFDDLLRRRRGDESDTRYAFALFLASVEQESDALALLEGVAPGERTASMAQLQQEAKGALERRERDAERARAEMLERRQGWSAAALDGLFRSGTAGKSQISAQELALAHRQGWNEAGRWLFRAAPARVKSGVLDLAGGEGATFGSLLLCLPLCADASPASVENGVAVAAGFERDAWRVDLGTTPIGFPVVNVVGGLVYKAELGGFSYSIDASRRAITSSLLSYAGTRDPNTGRTWGGVVATGARVNLSRDQGGANGAWALAGLHRLSGRNVQDNDRAELMAGAYRRLVNEPDCQLMAGVTGMLWRFSENAGEFTFGHGGYYSPRSYRSLSLPVTYGMRTARTSLSVRGSVSVSWSESRRAPFFPTDAQLQAQAEALAPATFVDPFYGGGSNGRSYGRALATVVEHQVAPRLFIGGRMELERSTNYTPNRFLLYVRYSPDGPAAPTVAMPPEPVFLGFPH